MRKVSLLLFLDRREKD